ncbi:Uma2 family endonuclease [Crocosphaera chwakensis]|uniref:Putative restriction endonuclease domain-containing protein n=1 Tax=Crocosphaera chwakensis CCY0110 TaxID=391612 RepID=A3IQX4_9CHRO|nr:Uma2 family endonuclease [Crocosphaera chwakensis]EAZ91179.1 hypothetical protein CY0110_12967 [Crocosphaera chwakensis CCY0110]
MIQTSSTITDQELIKLSSQNPELRFERNADGTLVTMKPADKISGNMEEYRNNGVKLGWLIDRHNQQALVYRQDDSITIYPPDAILNGETVIPGFTLALKILL